MFCVGIVINCASQSSLLIKYTTAQYYAEACFPIETYYRCNDLTQNCRDGNYIFQVTNTSATARISCPENTQIRMNGSMDYVIEDVYDTHCYEHSRNCTFSSPCNCCRAPIDLQGLCLSRHKIAQHIVDDCNSGKSECHFEIAALRTSAADIGHCVQSGTTVRTSSLLVGNNIGSINRIGGGLGGTTIFWSHARWAWVNYECLPHVTQPGNFNSLMNIISTVWIHYYYEYNSLFILHLLNFV